MASSETSRSRIALDVQGLGACVLEDISWDDEGRLRSHLDQPHRRNATACVDTLVSAALVSPQLTPHEVGALSNAKRRRLRLAALEVVGAATDYRRLGGSHLTADERAVAALVWRRERRVAISEALRHRLRERHKALAAGAIKVPAVKPVTGSFIRPLASYGIRPNVLSQLAGGFGASPLANLGVRPDLFKGISPAVDIGKRIGGLNGSASSGSVLSDSLVKSTFFSSDFNVLKQQVRGIASIYPIQSKPYVSPLGALGRDYFGKSGVSPLSALVQDHFAKSLPNNVLQAQLDGVLGSVIPRVDPSLLAPALSLAGVIGADTDRFSKSLAAAFRIRFSHRLSDVSQLSGLGQFGAQGIVHGRREFADFEQSYDDESQGWEVATAEEEAFWLIAALTAIRAQGANVARGAQQSSGRALDAAGAWMWEYPLSRLADYSAVTANLEPHERVPLQGSAESTAATLIVVFHQTYTAPFSGAWGLSVLAAWVAYRGFSRQVDALKHKQRNE